MPSAVPLIWTEPTNHTVIIANSIHIGKEWYRKYKYQALKERF